MKAIKITAIVLVVLYGVAFFGVRTYVKGLCPSQYRLGFLGGYCEPRFEDICAENGGRVIEANGAIACVGANGGANE